MFVGFVAKPEKPTLRMPWPAGLRLQVIPHRVIAFAPLLLIALSMYCVFAYHEALYRSIANLTRVDVTNPDEVAKMEKHALQTTPASMIPNGSRLMMLYLGIFLSAEGAFILMAIKEYLQDLLGFDDVRLIDPSRRVSKG
jgi:hypothetical protein